MVLAVLLRSTRYLESLSAGWLWALCVAMVGLVGGADLSTSADVAFTLAYLLPVAVAAWHLGAVASISIALLGTLLSLGIDISAQDRLPHPLVQAVNLVGQFCVFSIFGLIVARLREQLAREHRLATTDPLTGLANRRVFWDLVGKELLRGRRSGQTFSIAYLDVDCFKAVNDRHGHRAGDDVLVAIARLLVDSVRSTDCVARMGGDEFALLLPATAAAGAEVVVAKLRASLAIAPWNADHQVRCSVGCLSVEDPTADVDTVIARADALMLAVKASGKDGQRHDVLAPSPPVADR